MTFPSRRAAWVVEASSNGCFTLRSSSTVPMPLCTSTIGVVTGRIAARCFTAFETCQAFKVTISSSLLARKSGSLAVSDSLNTEPSVSMTLTLQNGCGTRSQPWTSCPCLHNAVSHSCPSAPHPSTVTFIVPPHLPLPQALMTKVYLVAFRIVARKGGFGVVGQHGENSASVA
ncbi:hypothetical protein SB00610_04497 [Klebsiella quasipneumoniae subsp. similipneumoniae]|nr:hypothetical protein SB00610_04497 [Klebsiella quasipneumoniae subsp. similipneumoniae]